MDRAVLDKGVYRFGPFMLDPIGRKLTCLGDPVRLTARPFDLLLYAVENAGRVIEKDELLTAVWGDRVVEEANLSQTISILRRTLREAGGEECIVTISGRGYRFAIEVERNAGAPHGQMMPHIPHTAAMSHEDDQTNISWHPMPALLSRGRWMIARRAGWLTMAAIIIAMVTVAIYGAGRWFHPESGMTPPRLSIVVLPFRNLSEDHDKDYLADAISDDLTSVVSQMPGSLVIARRTADTYRNATLPVMRIGRELNVRYVLEGTLQPLGNMLHINAQLVDAAHDSDIWVDHFDVTNGHLDEAQTAIEGRVESSLAIELNQVESARSWHDRPRNPDALDLYMRAMSILDRSEEPPAIARARATLEKAVRLKPDFADASAALAWALLGQDGVTSRDFQEGQQAAANALTVQPDNVVALSAWASIFLAHSKYVEAEQDVKAALALNPNKPEALEMLAVIDYYTGKSPDAVTTLHALLVRDPKSRKVPIWLGLLGEAYIDVGKFDLALDAYQQSQAYVGRVLPENGDRAIWARLGLISADALAGHIAVARTLCKSFLETNRYVTIWGIAAIHNRSYPLSDRFGRYDTGLRIAGIPDFADEHEDFHVPSTDWMDDQANFQETSLIIPGATTIDTKKLEAMRLRDPGLLIVDAGAGVAVPEHAVWVWSNQDQFDMDASVAPVIAPVQHIAHGGKAVPVVVMGDGPRGSLSYNAASRLVHDGYSQVYWYRGGEQSWAQAGLPAQELRR